MGNVTNLPTIRNGVALPAVKDFRAADLALIRRTVAADTNNDEFDLFISYCNALRLDPRRRQIYAFVYSKDNADRRKMSIVVAIDGLRTIAARSGDYRPDEDEARYEIDPQAKGPTNPLGLVKATVCVWKHSHGDWHCVTASAYWDEYAPIKEEPAGGYRWVETGEVYADSNKPKKRKEAIGEVQRTLDRSGKWGSMPRLMLAKVAEALALRKAWPDDFSGVYGEEEIDRAKVEDLSPSEAVAAAAVEARETRAGIGRAVTVDWLDNGPLEAVPVGKFADAVMAWLGKHAEEPSQILMFRNRNRHGLTEFWTLQPNDALAVKREMERLTAGDGGAA